VLGDFCADAVLSQHLHYQTLCDLDLHVVNPS
jgi:hypothetical protein